jgi:predicted enzyme related to lactoylglutathione lyase
MQAHPIVHIEIAAGDPGEAAAFYRKVFGWDTEHDEGFDYWQFSAEGGPGGGFVGIGEPYEAGDVVIYLASEDIEAALTAVQENGGAVIVPKTAIGEMGWYALFTDPSGNKLGLYAAAVEGD